MSEPATGLALPIKYAAIGAAALSAGAALSHLLGVTREPPGLPDYLMSAAAGAVGGVLGGLIRRRRGKTG